VELQTSNKSNKEVILMVAANIQNARNQVEQQYSSSVNDLRTNYNNNKSNLNTQASSIKSSNISSLEKQKQNLLGSLRTKEKGGILSRFIPGVVSKNVSTKQDQANITEQATEKQTEVESGVSTDLNKALKDLDNSYNTNLSDLDKQRKDAHIEIDKVEQEQNLAELQAQQKFNGTHVKLNNGEYIDKNSFIKLGGAEQDYLLKNGVDAFNNRSGQEIFDQLQKDGKFASDETFGSYDKESGTITSKKTVITEVPTTTTTESYPLTSTEALKIGIENKTVPSNAIVDSYDFSTGTLRYHVPVVETSKLEVETSNVDLNQDITVLPEDLVVNIKKKLEDQGTPLPDNSTITSYNAKTGNVEYQTKSELEKPIIIIELNTPNGKVQMPKDDWNKLSDIGQYATVLGRKPTLNEWKKYRVDESGIPIPIVNSGFLGSMKIGNLVGMTEHLTPGKETSEKIYDIEQSAQDEYIKEYPERKWTSALITSGEDLGFPVSKLGYNDYKLIKDDITTSVVSAAMWSLPFLKGKALIVGSTTTGGYSAYNEAENWNEMTTREKIVSTGGTLLISAPALFAAKNLVNTKINITSRPVLTNVEVKSPINITAPKVVNVTEGLTTDQLITNKSGKPIVVKVPEFNNPIITRSKLGNISVDKVTQVRVSNGKFFAVTNEIDNSGNTIIKPIIGFGDKPLVVNKITNIEKPINLEPSGYNISKMDISSKINITSPKIVSKEVSEGINKSNILTNIPSVEISPATVLKETPTGMKWFNQSMISFEEKAITKPSISSDLKVGTKDVELTQPRLNEEPIKYEDVMLTKSAYEIKNPVGLKDLNITKPSIKVKNPIIRNKEGFYTFPIKAQFPLKVTFNELEGAGLSKSLASAAYESGQAYRAYSKMPKVPADKATFTSKTASKIEIIQNTLFGNDLKFIKEFSNQKKLTPKQIKLLENATGYKGLSSKLQEYSEAKTKITNADKVLQTHKVDSNAYKIAQGKKDIAINQLKTVSDDLTNLLQPRYKPSPPTPNVRWDDIITQLKNRIYGTPIKSEIIQSSGHELGSGELSTPTSRYEKIITSGDKGLEKATEEAYNRYKDSSIFNKKDMFEEYSELKADLDNTKNALKEAKIAREKGDLTKDLVSRYDFKFEEGGGDYLSYVPEGPSPKFKPKDTYVPDPLARQKTYDLMIESWRKSPYYTGIFKQEQPKQPTNQLNLFDNMLTEAQDKIAIANVQTQPNIFTFPELIIETTPKTSTLVTKPIYKTIITDLPDQLNVPSMKPGFISEPEPQSFPSPVPERPAVNINSSTDIQQVIKILGITTGQRIGVEPLTNTQIDTIVKATDLPRNNFAKFTVTQILTEPGIATKILTYTNQSTNIKPVSKTNINTETFTNIEPKSITKTETEPSTKVQTKTLTKTKVKEITEAKPSIKELETEKQTKKLLPLFGIGTKTDGTIVRLPIGTIVWRQGELNSKSVWRAIPPNDNKSIMLKEKPTEYYAVDSGKGSAYRTVGVIGGVAKARDIKLGIMDIDISVVDGKPVIMFKRNEEANQIKPKVNTIWDKIDEGGIPISNINNKLTRTTRTPIRVDRTLFNSKRDAYARDRNIAWTRY
jgi:hypothetical protein